MKIEGRRAHIQQAIESGLRSGLDPARLRTLLEQTGATPAEVKSVFEDVKDQFSLAERRTFERFLAADVGGAGASVAGHRPHDVRADKRSPWWNGLQAQPPATIHPEPVRDVEVHGERFTRDDVVALLRAVAR